MFSLSLEMVVSPLQETLHNHKMDEDASHDESFDALKDLSHDPESHKASERNEKSSLLKNWPLVSSIIVYCIFSLHDMAYTEVGESSSSSYIHLCLFGPKNKIFSFLVSPIDLFVVGK